MDSLARALQRIPAMRPFRFLVPLACACLVACAAEGDAPSDVDESASALNLSPQASAAALNGFISFLGTELRRPEWEAKPVETALAFRATFKARYEQLARDAPRMPVRQREAANRIVVICRAEDTSLEGFAERETTRNIVARTFNSDLLLFVIGVESGRQFDG